MEVDLARRLLVEELRLIANSACAGGWTRLNCGTGSGDVGVDRGRHGVGGQITTLLLWGDGSASGRGRGRSAASGVCLVGTELLQVGFVVEMLTSSGRLREGVSVCRRWLVFLVLHVRDNGLVLLLGLVNLWRLLRSCLMVLRAFASGRTTFTALMAGSVHRYDLNASNDGGEALAKISYPSKTGCLHGAKIFPSTPGFILRDVELSASLIGNVFLLARVSASLHNISQGLLLRVTLILDLAQQVCAVLLPLSCSALIS